MAKVFIGTSGWSYTGWSGTFYPEEVKPKDFLHHYTESFHTTEINNSFYSLPSEKSVTNWRKSTPDDFIFAVKASRYITHNKKLKDPEKSIKRFFEAIKPLQEKTGPVLFQLPPNWSCNAERLSGFLQSLPGKYRYSFEFRDQSWLNNEIYDLLEQYNAALCFYDYKGYQSPEEVTSDFIYVRLHGPKKQAYSGSYDGRRLSSYAGKFKEWQAKGLDVYCYFDNDQKSRAPHDAHKIIKLLKKR